MEINFVFTCHNKFILNKNKYYFTKFIAVQDILTNPQVDFTKFPFLFGFTEAGVCWTVFFGKDARLAIQSCLNLYFGSK